MKNALACSLLLLATVVTACGGGAAKDAKYPPRAEGCEVQVFDEAPKMPTENIGPVSSMCDESISDADCMRTLMDEVCKLGGDVAWGVDPKPMMEYGKKKFSGRAAHTK